MILPDCGLHKARTIAEQLRNAVLALKLAHLKSDMSDQVTISLGVATMASGQACSAEELLASADLALYSAKGKGRNCVAYHEGPVAVGC